MAGDYQRARDGSTAHDGGEDPPGHPRRLDNKRHAADAFRTSLCPEGENLSVVPAFTLRLQAMIRSLREVILPALPSGQMLATDQANILVGYLRIMALQHDKVFDYLLAELSEYTELINAMV